MIMMPYGWTLDIAAAHRPGRLLAPHRRYPQAGFSPASRSTRSRTSWPTAGRPGPLG